MRAVTYSKGSQWGLRYLSPHCWMQLVKCSVTFPTLSLLPRQQLSSRGSRVWMRVRAALSPSWLLVSASDRISSTRLSSSGPWTWSTSSSRRFCNQVATGQPQDMSSPPTGLRQLETCLWSTLVPALPDPWNMDAGPEEVQGG